MSTHLKIAFVTSLLLFILMEEFNPVLAKHGERLKQRTKILETTVVELKEKIKALEECNACSKIKELNNKINELQEEKETNKPSTCPSGWSQFKEYCYLVNSNSQQWDTAKQYCRSLGNGVDLVKINNDEENKFVLQLVRDKAPSMVKVYIGLHWGYNTQSWAWSVDNSQPVYTNWNAGEPNGNANEPCGEMYTNASNQNINGYWNDLPCTESNGLVCKKLAS
ncbi:hypothetical protein ACROYT_G033127 [Oculina patagonica]